MNINVSKFGGTSVKNADSIRKVGDTLKNQGGSSVVVVSATGGTTDNLLEIGQKARQGGSWQKGFEKIKERHERIIDKLDIDLDLSELYEELENLLQGISLVKELTPAKTDHLVSFGERISSLILNKFLNKEGLSSERVNAKEIIRTDNSYTGARVDFETTNNLIEERLPLLMKDNDFIVVTGYIASSEEGQYSTLGRGGSDFTAAIIAAALDAQELRIYTDVDGIYSCDPSLIDKAQVIPELSFDEAGELAYFGAKVLHPKTILPAVEKNIPVRVLNTFNSESEGTLITKKTEPGIKAIAWKDDNVIVNIQSVRMLEAYGFLARIFDIFAKYGAVVDVLATSEVSVSLTLEQEPPEGLVEEISEFAEVSVRPGFAVVCLVGDNLINQNGVLGKLFSEIEDHKTFMISQGASDRNITFLVNQDEVETIVKKIFNKFFTNA